MAFATDRQIQRGIFTNVVAICLNTVIALAPAMGVLGNEGPLKDGQILGVRAAIAAIKHFSQCIHAGSGQVVEKIPAPLPCRAAGTGLVTAGHLRRCLDRFRDETLQARVIVITGIAVEIAEIVNFIRLVTGIHLTVIIQIRSVVIGLVVELVIPAHGEHHQRRGRLRHKQGRIRQCQIARRGQSGPARHQQ